MSEWIPPGQGSLVGKKFSLMTFAMALFAIGIMTLWEADRSTFSPGVTIGIVLIAFGVILFFIREVFLAKGLPEPVITGEDIENVQALVQKYASYTKHASIRLADVSTDPNIKLKLNAIADIAAELET